MNELMFRGTQTVSSLEVAEMVEKRHDHLLRAIDTYIEYLTNDVEPKLGDNGKINILEYFIETESEVAVGFGVRKDRAFEITKKGCEFIANKMTGQKGTQFTATYIEKFHAMKDTLQSQNSDSLDFQDLTPQLQFMINTERKQKELEVKLNTQQQELSVVSEKVDNMKNIIALNPNNWRTETAHLINRMAEIAGGFEHISAIRQEIYNLLDLRMRTNMKIRLSNMRKTAAENGMSESKRKNIKILDVIANDPKLIEGFIAIVKERAIKFGVELSGDVIPIEKELTHNL